MSRDAYRGMAPLQLRTIPCIRDGPEQYPDNEPHIFKSQNRLRKRPVSVYRPQSSSLQFRNSTSTAREPRISDAYVDYCYGDNQEYGKEFETCAPANILQFLPTKKERRRSMSFFWKPLTRKDNFLETQSSTPTRPAWYAPILPRSRHSLDSAQQRTISIHTSVCPDSPASVQSCDSAYYSASDASSKSPARNRNTPFKWTNITSPSSPVAPLYPIELPCLDLPTLSPVDLSPIPRRSSSPCPSSIYPVELPASTCIRRESSSSRDTTHCYTEPCSPVSEILASEYIGLIARDSNLLSYEDGDTSSLFSTNTSDKPPALRHKSHKLSTIEETAPTRRILRHKASSHCLRRKPLIAEASTLSYNTESSSSQLHSFPSPPSPELTSTSPTHSEPPSKAPTPPPRSILRCHESFRSQLATGSSRSRTQDSKIQVLIDAFESLQLELEGRGSDSVDMKQVRNLGDAYGRVQGLLTKDRMPLDHACRS